MGGLYGDLIYHHVAASRKRVLFHNTPTRDLFQIDAHQQLRNGTENLLFSSYDMYMAWLQGKEVAPQFSQRMARLCALADHQRSLNWWLDRARSPYIHHAALKKMQTGVAAKVLASPFTSRLKAKATRTVNRLLNVLHMDEKTIGPQPLHAMTSPFGKAHLYPLPSHGWTTQAPAFVGIGAPKSGTSFFHQLLLQHPQIVHPRIHFENAKRKETQYFLHFQHRNLPDDAIATYREAFAAPPGAICGEFSVQYLAYPTCLEHLALAAPNTKILLILRNPIDRFISHLNHLITKRGALRFSNATDGQRYLLHTFSFYTEAALHSLYSVGLARLYQYFNRDQILLLQYERLMKEPEAQLTLAYRFLGVDDRFRGRGYQNQVNKGIYAIPKPDLAERQRLATYFEEDVKRTFALGQALDPNLWPDFIPIV